MYVRKTITRHSTCFQLCTKINGKLHIIKHIGCASTSEQIEILQTSAHRECERLKLEIQPTLFPSVRPMVKAILSQWHITGYHTVFGSVYDCIGFPSTLLRDLVIARIVYPRSKLATVRYLDQHLGIALSEDKIYRFLDTLQKNNLTKIAYDFVSKKHNGIALIFYDVTTLYFETNIEDDLRKKGWSKDHKNELPQIVIGLFVDKEGYPFDFDFYDGSTFEGHTFSKAIKALTEKYHVADLVVVADAGMLSEKNIVFLETEKLQYIVGARLKSLSEKFKECIFAHDFTKEPIFETSCHTTMETREKKEKRLIVDFSEKRAQKDAYNRKNVVKKLEEKIVSKKELIKKSKYIILKHQGTIVGIDQEKINQDARHDGLKGYWTNITTSTSPREIIDQYHNLWKVEKAFRMSKNDLQERPIFHRKQTRISGHLLICFCSLLVMKEAEKILSPTGISLLRAIEILGKVGAGVMKCGNIQMPIESEINFEAKSILHQISGN